MPQLSIVVPVYNGGAHLRRCLEALLASDFQNYEIIIVDDCSTDDSAAICHALKVDVLRLAARRGPAAARNRGARHARGAVIMFVDADVVVRRDTLARVARFFSERPQASALFGSYDEQPAASNFISQYKNLLHHFVHQRSRAEATTFWAGCGAVRREAFEAVGGFDERKYDRPSIEDIELGYRLRREAREIVLDRELQVQHLKCWTFLSLLRADIFQRAIPWSRLMLEHGWIINDLNLRTSDRISAALTPLSLVLLVLSYFSPLSLIPLAVTLATFFYLNSHALRFLKQRRGAWFALKSFAMLGLYYFYSGMAFTLVYGAHVLRAACAMMRATDAGRLTDA